MGHRRQGQLAGQFPQQHWYLHSHIASHPAYHNTVLVRNNSGIHWCRRVFCMVCIKLELLLNADALIVAYKPHGILWPRTAALAWA